MSLVIAAGIRWYRFKRRWVTENCVYAHSSVASFAPAGKAAGVGVVFFRIAPVLDGQPAFLAHRVVELRSDRSACCRPPRTAWFRLAAFGRCLAGWRHSCPAPDTRKVEHPLDLGARDLGDVPVEQIAVHAILRRHIRGRCLTGKPPILASDLSGIVRRKPSPPGRSAARSRPAQTREDCCAQTGSRCASSRRCCRTCRQCAVGESAPRT
jgi:hypothetical protein